MKLTYEKCGDYLVPNLVADPEPEGELWKYGLMRRDYLKNYHRGIYSGMLLNGKFVVRQIKRSDIRHIKSGLIHGI